MSTSHQLETNSKKNCSSRTVAFRRNGSSQGSQCLTLNCAKKAWTVIPNSRTPNFEAGCLEPKWLRFAYVVIVSYADVVRKHCGLRLPWGDPHYGVHAGSYTVWFSSRSSTLPLSQKCVTYGGLPNDGIRCTSIFSLTALLVVSVTRRSSHFGEPCMSSYTQRMQKSIRSRDLMCVDKDTSCY